MDGITVFGVDNCEETQRSRRFLDSRNISYKYVNLDQDKAAEEMVKKENHGKRRIPFIEVTVGNEVRVLREPSDEELADAVRDLKVIGAA
ncbi:MAG: glutaredoxin family protein [Terriglobales bacterium]